MPNDNSPAQATSAGVSTELALDHHEALRREAHDAVLEQLQNAHAQGLVAGTFGLCVFHVDDPVIPDELRAQSEGAEFVVVVLMRDVLKQALLSIDLPTRASGVRWNPRTRQWVDRNGKISSRHERYLPYTEHAKLIDVVDAPGEFLVVTFVRGSVGIVRAILTLKAEA